jgi:hypothetical protein
MSQQCWVLKNATWCGLIYFADHKTMWHDQKHTKNIAQRKDKIEKQQMWHIIIHIKWQKTW